MNRTYGLECTTSLEREVEVTPNAGDLVDDLEPSNRRLNESLAVIN